MAIEKVIADFTTLAIQSGNYMEMDRVYVENKIKNLIGDVSGEFSYPDNEQKNAKALAGQLISFAKENGRDVAEHELLEFLTPPPSVVNAYFSKYYSKEEKLAIDYYHKLLENIGWFEKAETPEKYTFAMEGYENNLRIIRLNLHEESWGFVFLKQPTDARKAIVFSERESGEVADEKMISRLFLLSEVFQSFAVEFSADELQNEHAHFYMNERAVEKPQNAETVVTEFPLTELYQVSENHFYLESFNEEEAMACL
jgi:UDPglucose--hexose-1-phosphate uridylyltransferase